MLQLVFSVYQPEDLGIIDYHAPTRAYAPEKFGNINLHVEDNSQQRAQHALYNTQAKYTNIKKEMARSFVMELISERAGTADPSKNSLQETLDELFTAFFPGKKFLGVVPREDGSIEFPVQIENGRQHDINDLSSGEKEMLLGYLRLRNSAPRNSIILLDEPELHLNPRLARSLPRFYEKHLSDALSNQIWLVTHSDTILRQAAQEPSYNVYHMQPASEVATGAIQTSLIELTEEVEEAIINLVGDLAAYSPRSKVILVEGEDAEFDSYMIATLFPEFVERVNLVSFGKKNGVKAAHKVLEKASEDGRLDAHFFSIVDRNFFGEEIVKGGKQFAWDAYHIENYLIVPKYICEVLKNISAGQISKSEEQILNEIKECARETIEEIVQIKLRDQINRSMIGGISLKYDPSMESVAGFRAAIERSFENVSKCYNEEFSASRLGDLEKIERQDLIDALSDDRWLADFRGRNILKRFAGKQGRHISYNLLRNLIIESMKEDNYQPHGMKAVVKAIDAA